MESPGVSSIPNGDIELSIVIPCYNEEEAMPVSIPPLLHRCQELNLRHEVILVNNGSWDSTPEIIDSFISQGYPVQRVDVAVNHGPGWGVICGLGKAKGKYVAYMCADGQIKPEDVVRIFRAIQGTERGVMAKARRVYRLDGWRRRFLSWVFNLFFLIIFGGITPDVNGMPKIFHREDLQRLKPTEKWVFQDAEFMIKAKALGFKIIEVPVTSYQRQGGKSAVRMIHVSLTFLKDIIRYRCGKNIKNWLAEEHHLKK